MEEHKPKTVNLISKTLKRYNKVCSHIIITIVIKTLYTYLVLYKSVSRQLSIKTTKIENR